MLFINPEGFRVKSSESQSVTYGDWYDVVESSGLTGDLIWQTGVQFYNGASSPDDGFAIFNTSAAYPVVTAAVAAFKGQD